MDQIEGRTRHDEAAAWDKLNARFEMRRINYEKAYSDGEACTNWAESYFSRLRRGEMGHFHHVSGPYLLGTPKKLHGVKMRGGSITDRK